MKGCVVGLCVWDLNCYIVVGFIKYLIYREHYRCIPVLMNTVDVDNSSKWQKMELKGHILAEFAKFGGMKSLL